MYSILYYTKFRKEIEYIGFEVHPYYIFVANEMKSGKHQTVIWNIHDLKSIHVDPKLNEEFAEWCEDTDGSDYLGHVKVVRGKIHDYMGMIMDLTQDGALRLI